MDIAGRQHIATELVDNKYGGNVVCFLPGTLPATSTNYGVFFTAIVPIEVIAVIERHGTASNSGTIQLQNVPSGTAAGSGNNILASTISTAGTADTNIKRSGFSELNSYRKLDAGDSLALVNGGTLTNLVNLTVTVYFKPLGRGDYR